MKTASKLILAALILRAFTFAAQAKLSPYEPQQYRATADAPTIASMPFDFANERDYFQAPDQTSKPVARAVPCTVKIIVFDKARLAQACY